MSSTVSARWLRCFSSGWEVPEAAFAALAAAHHLSVNVAQPSGRRSGLGFPLHDGREHIGHLGRAARGTEGEFLAAWHTVRCLAANPDAAALFLEALGPETLAILGRAALRRIA